MFRFEVDDTVFIDDQRLLEAAMSNNPQTQKRLRELVRLRILEARRAVVQNLTFANGDPNDTRRSVRSTTYRKIFGGNLNILNSKTKHGEREDKTVRRGRGHKRGGNRMAVGARTKQVRNAADRQFILRFVNSGTRQRFVGFRNEKKKNSRRYTAVRWHWEAGGTGDGNRGAIAARNFFQQYGENALNMAANRLADMIEKELTDILDKK